MKKTAFYVFNENTKRGMCDELIPSDALICDVPEIFEEELKEKRQADRCVTSNESTSEEDLSYAIAEARKIHCFLA